MTNPVTVNSPAELIAVIEAAFGTGNIQARMAEAERRPREALAASVLSGISQFSHALPRNWAGERDKEEGAIIPARELFSEARRAFTSNLEDAIIHGVVGIRERTILGGFEIKFPDRLFTGTGEAAAVAVAASLEHNGVSTRVNGRAVTFWPDEKSATSVRELMLAVRDFGIERNILLS